MGSGAWVSPGSKGRATRRWPVGLDEGSARAIVAEPPAQGVSGEESEGILVLQVNGDTLGRDRNIITVVVLTFLIVNNISMHYCCHDHYSYE